jgi:hypothetical protein
MLYRSRGLTDSLSADALFFLSPIVSNRQQNNEYATSAVAASSTMLPLVTAQAVASERGGSEMDARFDT